MESITTYVSRTTAPIDRSYERIDARDLPPPKPLTTTLEHLESIDDSEGIVQLNDRRPQLLYPKLDDRGYLYDTIETDDAVVTVIWSP